MLHVELYPNCFGKAQRLASVASISEAMQRLTALCPTAIRKAKWAPTYGGVSCDFDFDQFLERPWLYATLSVFSDSQAMELDDLGDRLLAVIVNESDLPPEPNAAMQCGPVTVVANADGKTWGLHW